MKIFNGANKKISFPIAIIIIIALAVLVGGLAVWQYFKIPAKIELPEIETSADQTADWKTYKNEEYGFEIKYPVNLIVNKTSESNLVEFITKKENFEFGVVVIRVEKEIKTIEELYEKSPFLKAYKDKEGYLEKVLIGENQYEAVVEYDHPTAPVMVLSLEEAGTAQYFIEHLDRIYCIVYIKYPPPAIDIDSDAILLEENIFIKMLSTFRFLE